MKMIWRDDDPSVLTKIEQFAFCHEIFQKYKVIHTLALIMKDIEKNKDLVRYIKANQKEFDIQLHCWEHFDHDKNIEEAKFSIGKGKAEIERIFGVTPTIFYPPWNSSNQELSDYCTSIGLTARPDKISISQYIRVKGAVKEDTCNFHYWYEPEVNDLHKALSIYKNNNL